MNEPGDRRLPWIINLELTNACNLACVFCDHARLVAEGMKTADMEPALLEKTLTELGDEVLPELGLVGLGEPTLDRRLWQHLDIIDRHAHRFERVSVNSNLISLGESIARRLLGSSVNAYTFSLNASNRTTYQKMMGRDRFDRAVANLNSFLALLETGGRKVNVAVQVFDSPQNSLDEVRRLVPEWRSVRLFVREIYSKPVIRESGELLKVHSPEPERRYPCWDMYTRVYLDVQGNVYPCTIGNDCYRAESELCLGNVREAPLLEVFNNGRIREARRQAELGNIPFPQCRPCNVWSLTPNNLVWDAAGRRWTTRERPIRAYGLKE